MADEQDPVRSAFDELRAEAWPLMRPVGVEGVTSTVRRRRHIRSAVAVLTVLAIGGLAYGFGGTGPRAAGYNGASVVATSAAPSPFPSPAPIESTSQPAASALSRPSTKPTHRSTQHPPVNHPTAKKACAADGIGVSASGGGGSIEEAFVALGPHPHEAPCAGIRVPLFWASYAANADGSGALYASGTAYLDATHLVVSLPVRTPATCARYFIGHNVALIPTALSAGVMSPDFSPSPEMPFWDARHQRSGIVQEGQLPCPSVAPSASD
jgi:hypothetical protein